MNAIQALQEIKLNSFHTKQIVPHNGENMLITDGRAIKLHKNKSGELFGLLGINLPDLITARNQSRATVVIPKNLQNTILQMAEGLAKEQYMYNNFEENFDFCLHAPVARAGKNLELLPSTNWVLHPTVQWVIKPITSNAKVRVLGNTAEANFNNPDHLVCYFLGSSRFSYACNLEEEAYKLGRNEVYSIDDLFSLIAKTPKYIEVGERPHIPAVEGRLLQLMDVLNEYVPKENNLSTRLFDEAIDFYANLASLREESQQRHHDISKSALPVEEEEGW